MRIRSVIIAAAVSVFGAAGAASAGNVIVNLPAGSAVVTSNDTAGQTASGISNSVLPTSAVNAANGLTLNLTVTPTAADLVGTRLLMEIGGSSNGAGFFLVNGVPTLVSKQNSSGTTVPSSSLDTDLAGDTMTVRYAGGTTLLANSTYTLAAVLAFASNAARSATIAVDNGGLGNAITSTTYSLTDATTNGINWVGNSTVSVRTKATSAGSGPNIGHLGGTHETATADGTFFAGTANSQLDGVQSFAGTTADGFLWNAVGSVVPEPASASLLLLGGAGLLAKRRHRRASLR